MFCQNANQSLRVEAVAGKGSGSQSNSGYYDKLFKILAKVEILKEGTKVPSKEVGPLLLKLLEEFKRSSDSSNRNLKQIVFIWALRKYLGREIAF